MKKLLFMAALLTSTAAMAQTRPPAAPGAAPNAAREQHFAERKAEVLKRIGDHIAELQKRQACVQAASVPGSIKACFPNGGEGAAK